MINIFSNFKIIFYFFNICLIFIYLFPGSLPGFLFYGDKKIQPQITPDFIISSNHFYVFFLLSLIGYLTFKKTKKIKCSCLIYFKLLKMFAKTLKIYIK